MKFKKGDVVRLKKNFFNSWFYHSELMLFLHIDIEHVCYIKFLDNDSLSKYSDHVNKIWTEHPSIKDDMLELVCNREMKLKRILK